MKKRMTAFLLAALMVACLAGCSERTVNAEPTNKVEESPSSSEVEQVQEEEKFDAETIYSDTLAEMYDVVSGAKEGCDNLEGSLGICEVARVLGDTALDTMAYAFQDVNEDGVEELLVGVFDKKEEDYTKNELYAVYTYDGEQVILLLEGASRNSYSLMEGGSFFNSGSSGIMYSSYGQYELTAEGELLCKDFYFTSPKGDSGEVAFYHNTSGVWETSASEELEMDLDQFASGRDELAAKTVAVEGNVFAALDNK